MKTDDDDGKRTAGRPRMDKGAKATMKEVEIREIELKKKKKEALANKESKDAKRAAKTTTAKKDADTEKTKENENKPTEKDALLAIASIDTKIAAIENNFAQILRQEMKEALGGLGETIADTVKQGLSKTPIFQDPRTSQQEDVNDPLATQELIHQANLAHQRLINTGPTIRPSGTNTVTPQSNQTTIPPGQLKDTQNMILRLEDTQDPALQNLPTIYPTITKDELCITINKLIQKVNYLQDQLNTTKLEYPAWPKLQTKKPPREPILLPALNIDINGSQDPQEITRIENQPIDFTVVRTARKYKDQRPLITGDLKTKVNKELKDHIKNQRNLDIKPRPQKEMEPQARSDKIVDMLNKQSLIVGFAPISSSHLETVTKKMIERGVMRESEPRDQRLQRTIKSVIKSWAYKNLKITDEEWSSIQVEEITQMYAEDSNIIFLRCKTQDDISKITSKARNLPHDSTGQGPRLVNYVDKRAKARYRAIQQIAKTIREESQQSVQMNIRTG